MGKKRLSPVAGAMKRLKKAVNRADGGDFSFMDSHVDD
jgi:hypothetical protein